MSVITSVKSDLANAYFVNPYKGLRRRNTTGKYFIVNKMNAVFNKVFMHFFLDEAKSWTKGVLKKLNNIHKTEPVDLVISSF